MELRQLKYFLKAKELLNFTEAAASLYISQSTLSQQIKQLEDELGVLLFDRIGKRIMLTEAGELFSDYAMRSINSANSGFQLLKDLKELKTGELRIGVTYALKHVLTTSLIEFSTRYPNILVQVTFGTSDEMLLKLEKLELDFVLSFKEWNVKEYFNYQTLFSSSMALIVSKKSTLAEMKTVSIKEISSYPLALPARGFSTRNFISQACENKQISLNVLIEMNDIPTLLELVKTGNYCTILTETTVSNDQNLFTIPIKGQQMLRQAVIVSMKEIYEKKATRAFFEVIFWNIYGHQA